MPAVQIAFPGAIFDLDPATLSATRRRIFDMVATDCIPVAGLYLDAPFHARLDRAGDGYRLVPIAVAPNSA